MIFIETIAFCAWIFVKRGFNPSKEKEQHFIERKKSSVKAMKASATLPFCSDCDDNG